jgi:hypothetical protein
LTFKVIGGDSAGALTEKIDELSDSGYLLQTIHWGAISVTSPLSSSEWWNEAKKQFKAGANVIAVLEPKS